MKLKLKYGKIRELNTKYNDQELIFPKLYKYVKGKILVWEIKGTNEYEEPLITTTYGYANGKMQSNEEWIGVGKNVGKLNATSPWEQACLEAEARFVKQLERKGYGLDPKGKESAKKRSISPMLAKDFNKVELDCSHVYVQPKLDGHRCLIYFEGGEWKAKSRQNKPITTIPHILKEFSNADKRYIYDGEIYNHGQKFEDMTSAIKKQGLFSGQLQFHCYDVICFQDDEFRHRRITVERNVLPMKKSVVVPTFYVPVNKIDKHYRAFVKNMYEGAMVRIPDSRYEAGKRSSGLLKMKKFQEEEFKIVGVKEGRRKFKGMAVFTCSVPKAFTTFNVLSHGTHKEKKQHWQQQRKAIGKRLTVKFFEKTKNGIPRFPIAVRFREDV